MSAKRLRLSRKAPTQVELERELAETKRRVQQLEKRLKQAVRQLRQYEDTALDEDAEEATESVKEVVESDAGAFMTFVLPDGKVKRIPKRMAANE